jgi:hypothetical protein
MEDFSDNVEQLIRETDAAFQAVGNALADAKAATRGWYDNNIPVVRNTSVSRGILRKTPRSSIALLKPQSSRSSTSIAKSKKKPVNRNILDRALQAVPPTSASTPSRWTLTDMTTNVVNVFSGKIFRTEVDEMLTAGRRQQLQESIGLSQEHRESANLAHGAETDEDTPIEPFHLQSLSDRLDAAQKDVPPFPSPVFAPPAIPRRHPGRPARPKPPQRVQFADPGANEARMTVNDVTFPTPPRISHRPSASGSAPHLPTIPEISPLTLSPADRFTSVPSILQIPSQKLESEENSIFLPSTPFTLTSPLFRHGTIRVPIPYREPKFASDEEVLDWTAFQMAISGTGGIDGYADSYEREEREKIELEEMEQEAHDILQWWAGFGFQGWGRMVGDGSLKAQGRRRESLIRRKRGDDIGLVGAREATVSPPHSEYPKSILDTEKVVVADNSGMGNETGNEVQRRRSLAESLPPSPMLDLVVGSPSKDNEVIPMGFNLGHDLGDFLRWETNHVQTLFIDD